MRLHISSFPDVYLCLVLEFYPQIVDAIEKNRPHKIHKFRIAIWCAVVLFTADETEKLLRSTELIDKSDDYDFMHQWLGQGLLTR